MLSLEQLSWQKSADEEWSCALQGRILSLRQDRTYLYYRSYFPPTPGPLPTPPSSVPPSTEEGTPDKDDTEALIKHYFNLGANLIELYHQWSAADKNFKKKAP